MSQTCYYLNGVVTTYKDLNSIPYDPKAKFSVYWAAGDYCLQALWQHTVLLLPRRMYRADVVCSIFNSYCIACQNLSKFPLSLPYRSDGLCRWGSRTKEEFSIYYPFTIRNPMPSIVTSLLYLFLPRAFKNTIIKFLHQDIVLPFTSDLTVFCFPKPLD